MATPDFVAQNDSNFVPIRYYTSTDPYFYTVDNRPLQDIESNLKASRSGGADAARRAAFLNSMNIATVISDLYSVPSYSTAPRVMTGLAVTVPSTNTVTIGPGAVYESRQISTSITDTTVKMAIMTKASTFSLTAPVSAGTSIVYTIEGTFVELTGSNMSSSLLPNIDATNAYLPSTLTHGELQLSLNSGTAAATASAVAPATTNGKFPLYNVTLTQGVTNPIVTTHPNSPFQKGLNEIIDPVALASGSAGVGVVSEMYAVSFADAATSGVSLPFSGSTRLNPFKPIKVKITFTSTVASGNVVFRLRYASFGPGDVLTNAVDPGTIEVVACPGTANSVSTVTFATVNVPNTSFAALSSGAWTVVKDRISMVLERLGAHASDTNTGTANILQITLIQ